MQRKARFQQSTAATLRFAPPEGKAITAATVALFYADGTTLQASTAATLPAVATTLSSAATAGASTVAVTSAASVVPGDWYWVGSGTDTPIELVRVAGIASTTLTLAEELQFSHVSGATFGGTDITYALTATHTAALGRNYRALWGYTVGATAYKATTTFDVVLVPFRLLFSAADLATRIPAAVRRSASEVLSLRDFMVEAEDMLLRDLERRRIVPDWIRNTGQLRGAAILACAYVMLARAAQVDPGYRQQSIDVREEYERELAAALANVDWLDYSEENIAAYSATTGFQGVGDRVAPSAFGAA